MGIIGWIVLGLIVGALAKLVMPGGDKGGIFITMALGVVGGILGGFIGRVLFNTDLGTFWDIRTTDWKVGNQVSFEAFNDKLWANSASAIPHAQRIRKL